MSGPFEPNEDYDVIEVRFKCPKGILDETDLPRLQNAMHRAGEAFLRMRLLESPASPADDEEFL